MEFGAQQCQCFPFRLNVSSDNLICNFDRHSCERR
jgi:hypothetical protein